MKINIDLIIYQLQKSGGISVVWNELLKQLIKYKLDVDYIIQPKETDNIFYKEICDSLTSKVIEPKIPVMILRYLPILRPIKNICIFHSTYYRVKLSKKAINVTTIHDFTYEFYSKGVRKWIHSAQKGFAIRRSKAIICVSENTKNDLLKFYPDLKADIVKVIYNGVGNEYYKISKELYVNEIGVFNEKPFLLYVGNREGYKNFEFAVKVASNCNMGLLVIGGATLSEREKAQLQSELENDFIHLNGVNNDLLNRIYNKAFCLVYPSLYEGFGIPVLEAQRAGCPVIANNNSSLPEVMGSKRLLMQDYDINDWKNKIFELKNLEFRKDIIEEGIAYANNFTWKRAAQQLTELYTYLSARYSS